MVDVSLTMVLGTVLVALAGSGLVWQNGMNSTLGRMSGSTSFACVISFALGIMAMFAFFFIQTYALGTGVPSVATLRGACPGYVTQGVTALCTARPADL
jgi:uncharacterized membrane protein YdcZ (DUF606 family)